MPISDLWTGAQRFAWEFVKAAYNDDYNMSAALREFRSGGGHIRTGDWSELWHRYTDAAATWERLYQFGDQDVVPESMHAIVNINYQQPYVMTFKADIRTPDGKILHDVNRQVESDRRMTMAEWQQGALELIMEDPSTPGTQILEMREVEFYKRSER